MDPNSTYILDNPVGTTQILADGVSLISNPMTALGDMIYGAAGGAVAKLTGSVTATIKFLSQTGDGSNSAKPEWVTITAANITNTPAGTIAATNVQAAINELDSDIVALDVLVDALGTTSTDDLVPYLGADTDVDLGSQDLITTGTITAATFTGVVPYTGAISDVNLGTNNLTTAKVAITGPIINTTDAATKGYVDQAIIDAHGLDGADGADGAAGTAGAAGAGGADGLTGPGVVYRGVYDVSTVYYNTSTRRDIVKYGSDYYLYAGASPSTPGVWNAGDWEAFGATFTSVATDILFANLAYIDNLGVREFQGVTRGAGDLDGTVETVEGADHVHNVTGNPDVYEVTLTAGSSGYCRIDVDGHYHDATWTGGSLDNTATAFAGAASYSGIVLSNPSAAKIVFTKAGGVIGTFSASTTDGITPDSATGTKTSTFSSVAQVQTITLTGTEGLADITIGGETYRIQFNDTLTQTATDFAEQYAAAVLSDYDLVVTSSGAKIRFTASVPGTSFAEGTIANVPNIYLGAIKIQGNDMWEDVTDGDTGTVVINNRSYNGGQTHYRGLLIKDGKGAALAQFQGDADGGTTALYSVILYAPYLPTSNADLTAGMIYRDGAGANATLKIV